MHRAPPNWPCANSNAALTRSLDRALPGAVRSVPTTASFRHAAPHARQSMERACGAAAGDRAAAFLSRPNFVNPYSTTTAPNGFDFAGRGTVSTARPYQHERHSSRRYHFRQPVWNAGVAPARVTLLSSAPNRAMTDRDYRSWRRLLIMLIGDDHCDQEPEANEAPCSTGPRPVTLNYLSRAAPVGAHHRASPVTAIRPMRG